MPKKFLLEHSGRPQSIPAVRLRLRRATWFAAVFFGKSSPPSAEGAPWKTRLWGKSRVASRAVGSGAKFVATACHPSGDGPRRKNIAGSSFAGAICRVRDAVTKSKSNIKAKLQRKIAETRGESCTKLRFLRGRRCATSRSHESSCFAPGPTEASLGFGRCPHPAQQFAQGEPSRQSRRISCCAAVCPFSLLCR